MIFFLLLIIIFYFSNFCRWDWWLIQKKYNKNLIKIQKSQTKHTKRKKRERKKERKSSQVRAQKVEDLFNKEYTVFSTLRFPDNNIMAKARPKFNGESQQIYSVAELFILSVLGLDFNNNNNNKILIGCYFQNITKWKYIWIGCWKIAFA